MSCDILAGNSLTVYGNFGFNSLSVCCYLMALLGKFFPFGWNLLCYCYCIGRVAMVTQHESNVYSMWHPWMCLLHDGISVCVVPCSPYPYDWSKFCTN